MTTFLIQIRSTPRFRHHVSHVPLLPSHKKAEHSACVTQRTWQHICKPGDDGKENKVTNGRRSIYIILLFGQQTEPPHSLSGSAEQGGVPQRHVAAHGSEAPRGARAGTRGSGGGGSARVDGSGVGERRLGEIDEARV